MILASIQSGQWIFESIGLFWLIVIAGFGALLVLIGVSMEVYWEKDEYANIKDFRRSNSIKHWGGRLVVWGLIWEVVFGSVLAIKDDIESRKNNPHTQPIYAFEATAKFLVKPLEPVPDFETFPEALYLPTVPWAGVSTNLAHENGTIILWLGQSDAMAKGDIGETQIASDEALKFKAIEANGTNRLIRYDIHFGGEHGHFFRNKYGDSFDFGNRSLSPNELDAVGVTLPIRCEIIAGELTISIDNGLTNRTFEFPRQKSFEQFVSSVATNGGFVALPQNAVP